MKGIYWKVCSPRIGLFTIDNGTFLYHIFQERDGFKDILDSYESDSTFKYVNKRVMLYCSVQY